MKLASKSAALLLIFFALAINDALACTTFCLKSKSEVLFGKNYDWTIGDGAVFVNRRGVSKWSSLEGEKNVAKWTSKYGSVTFNQYGWESPSGGMNEAGLVIELMWLDDTKYPRADSRPAIDVLEWIQFNLDTAATTAEVVANSEEVRIVSRVNLHYLVNDKRGNASTIEFLDGKLVAHLGKQLPVAALTNDTYTRSLNFSIKNDSATTRSANSLDRFARAALRTKVFDQNPLSEKEAVDYAFDTLKLVAQPGYTQWSIVYDQKRGKIYFRTFRTPQIRSIDITAFDYSCSSSVKMLDMNADLTGDVTTGFKPYTREANRDLVERAFSGTDFLRNVPAAARDAHASFPEKFACGLSSSDGMPESTQPAKIPAAVSWLEAVFPVYAVYKYIASS